MTQTKSLKKNALLNILKTICTIIFPLITFPYASRILLPEGTGNVNFANSIVAYFSIIASLGIGTYATREASRIRDNKYELSKFTLEIIIINLISTLIAYLLLIISLTFITKLNNYRTLIYISSLTLILNTLGINWLYSALEEFRYITIRTILFQILSIILLFTFVKSKEDYVIYAGIGVLSSVGSNILNIFHSHKYISLKQKFKIELKKHLKPILILFITSIAINIFTILDTSMLGFLSDSSEVGYYSAASKIVKMIRDLFPAVFTVLFARLSYYSANKDTDNIKKLSEKTLEFILLMAPPMIIGLFILMPQIVKLMCGENFFPSIITARILTPLLFISSYSGFLGGQLMLSMNKEKTYMWCMIFAAICDIILNLLFIPKFGALGAASATLITELLIFLTYTILLRKFLAQLNIKKHLIQCFIATILMGIFIIPENYFLTDNYIKLIVITITGITIYSIILFIFRNNLILQIFDIFLKNLHIKHKGNFNE